MCNLYLKKKKKKKKEPTFVRPEKHERGFA